MTWPQCSIHWHTHTIMLLVSNTPTLWYLSRVTHLDLEFASTNCFTDRPNLNSDINTTLWLVDTHYVPLWKSQPESTGMIHWHFNRPWDQSHCWPNEQEKFSSDLSLSRAGCSAGNNINNCNLIWRKPDILTGTNSTVVASGRVLDFRSDPMELHFSRTKL